MAGGGRGWWGRPSSWSGVLLLVALALSGVGCRWSKPPETQAPEAAQSDRLVVVDVATAKAGEGTARVYTGTTRPARQVSLRSQAEGRLLSLSREVGDRVQQGEELGRIDNSLLQSAVGEAEAELAARQFEVAQAEAELADVRTGIEAARVRFQQASSDAQRLQALASEGAVSAQDAEQAQTTLRTAEQALQSSQVQVQTRQKAVSAAQQRVEAQRAILAEMRQRLAFANLRAPLTGVVLDRLVEPGDLLLPGEAVLSVGDLSDLRVVIEVADNSLEDFSLGQTLSLQIDALPGEMLTGRVTRIAPVADSTSRLIPVEISLPNPGGRLGSGLLARVTPTGTNSRVVVVPQSALENAESVENQIFVVTTNADKATVVARSVQVGDRIGEQVAILAGLAPGERYVVRSGEPLVAGQAVELSLLSESSVPGSGS